MSEVSSQAEAFVCAWLAGRGWEILDRNFRTRRSEIDIIARRRDVTAFVEVKFASDTSRTEALGKMDPEKRRKMVHGASVYLAACPADGQLRFDFALVGGSPCDMRMAMYIEDAFRPGLF